MDALGSSDVFLFDRFRLNRRGGGLFSQDANGAWEPVEIGGRALEVLGVLVERHGDLVTRDEVMRVVWPGTAVEDNNLTVQISALRRVLDEGRGGGSCIQTAAGRGYRFVRPVMRAEQARPEPGSPPAAEMRTATLTAPRLSIVVLPFKNLSDDPRGGYLADGITDDLTTELTHIWGTFVVARETAYSFESKPTDVRKIGEELGVRYILEGSIRWLSDSLRVNARLVSGETGAHLWSDRFDEQNADVAVAQEQIVTRLKDSLSICMVEIENARSLHERPTNPDAFDLILRARTIRLLPPSLLRDKDTLDLYERALVLIPSSATALVGVAFYLLMTTPHEDLGGSEVMQRIGTLLAQARTIVPDSPEVANASLWWLRAAGRYSEVIEAAEQAIRMNSSKIRMHMGFYNELGRCKTWSGEAEAEIALQAKLNLLNPRSPWQFQRYHRMGWASLLLGRYQDAIAFLQRSLAVNPDVHYLTREIYRRLAAAYAGAGQMREATHWLTEADRLWPYDTVRSHFPDYSPSSVYAEQIKLLQAALRLAGERDHADEDADSSAMPDNALHSETVGHTPTDAPGARTIRTMDLSRLLAVSRPLVVDTMSYWWGVSIPGSVGLKYAGSGGILADTTQDRLRIKMHELTACDFKRPIVAVGWNTERFDGRNLSLRLVALGYTNVHWYRGGREAWEVAGLPEAEIDVHGW
jgi:adenylate cyclase